MLIEYIPLQQGLRLKKIQQEKTGEFLIEYIPLQQGLRLDLAWSSEGGRISLSIFHYNKD